MPSGPRLVTAVRKQIRCFVAYVVSRYISRPVSTPGIDGRWGKTTTDDRRLTTAVVIERGFSVRENRRLLKGSHSGIKVVISKLALTLREERNPSKQQDLRRE